MTILRFATPQKRARDTSRTPNVGSSTSVINAIKESISLCASKGGMAENNSAAINSGAFANSQTTKREWMRHRSRPPLLVPTRRKVIGGVPISLKHVQLPIDAHAMQPCKFLGSSLLGQLRGQHTLVHVISK